MPEQEKKESRNYKKIPHRAWTGKYPPMSSAQRRMWLLDRIQPHQIAYINIAHYKAEGHLNYLAFRLALLEIVHRHEVLRTTYKTIHDEPVQVALDNDSFHLPLIDTQALTKVDQDKESHRVVATFSAAPFFLADEASLRVMVIRFSVKHHAIVWSIHHIATDGWSNGIFMHELSTLYNAYCNFKPNPLLDLPIQYADYASWQRLQLEDNKVKRQLDYWQCQLKDLTPLELPTDHPRPAVQTYRGGTQSIQFSQEQTSQLKNICRREKVTLYMLLMAGFMVLLHRITRQDDIAVGTPVANRTRQEFERLIGFFVNSLLIRVDFRKIRTFQELLQVVKEVALNALSNQDLPFEKLVEELHPERSLSRTPLFQVIFALQNPPQDQLNFQGIQLHRMPSVRVSTRFDLECHLWDSVLGIRGRLVYNQDLFESETIRQMAVSFQTIVIAFIHNLDIDLSEYSILSEQQKLKILYNWGYKEIRYPQAQSVHQLFDETVERYPDLVAVCHKEINITYSELKRRANQLANFLQKLGVRIGSPVGVCTERSIDLVIAILGIIKTGAHYVPLDPSIPQKRLSSIAADIGLSIILTHTQYMNHLEGIAAQLVCLDSQWRFIKEHPEVNLTTDLHPSLPIYIMYTSGSSGEPKGIVIPHKAVISLVKSANYVSLGSTENIAFASNMAFDASTFELWGTLLNGGTIQILDKNTLLAPRLLETELRSRAITTLFLTTALFNAVIRENPDAFASLRQLLFGGESVTPKWVKSALEQGAPRRLIHVYGPTETTTFATWYLVKDVQEDANSVPIGSPVSNTQLYVLDPFLQPLPPGFVGELCIGGDGLTMGYVNQPRLTAEKLVPNPFAKEPGSRMYRTGDLVRWLPNGVLEFVGRIDQQVKIRGYRIELEEIELFLSQHPAIREACVMVQTNREGDKQLVAFIVCNYNIHPNIGKLRQYLKLNLPEYMIPSKFVQLDSIPLTPSGKVDRQHLVLSDDIDREIEQDNQANNIEKLLTHIWKSVLQVDSLSIYDNFFDIGGHSLLGVQMLDKIYSFTGRDIPVSALFEAPTIAQLASLLQQKNWLPNWSALVPIRTEGKRPPLFMVPPAGNTVLGFAHIIMALNTDQPIYGLQYKGMDGVQPPLYRMEDIAAYFIDLIREVQPSGPYYMAGICFGSQVVFEIAHQFHQAGQEVAILILLDGGSPASGPSWVGGVLVHKQILNYVRYIVDKIRRRELKMAIKTQWNALKHRLFKRYSSQKNKPAKRKIGAQQVLDACTEARNHYKAEVLPVKIIHLASVDFNESGYVKKWSELASDNFIYEVFEDTTHTTMLLDNNRGAKIAERMQYYLDEAVADKGI